MSRPASSSRDHAQEYFTGLMSACLAFTIKFHLGRSNVLLPAPQLDQNSTPAILDKDFRHVL